MCNEVWFVIQFIVIYSLLVNQIKRILLKYLVSSSSSSYSNLYIQIHMCVYTIKHKYLYTHT